MSDVASAGGTAEEKPPLDDVMLAMDVVDTLRRRERLVERELDEEGREQDLKQRLKRIYAQQGIEVPDHVLEQGVAALREDRFTYKPPKSGFGRRLALWYVTRGRWGKWVGGGTAAALLAAAGNYFAFVAPQNALPEALAESHKAAVAVAATDRARALAQSYYDAGKTALRAEDKTASRQALSDLQQLQTRLSQEYTIQIVNRPGLRSGVWRIPDVNQNARNYYVVVEAIAPTGKLLSVPIKSEETGKTKTVSAWGLRVDESTFEKVKRDKQDDGIIENDRFGYKARGHAEPTYDMPTSGGAITEW